MKEVAAVANAPTASALGRRYWLVPVVRAVVALIPAVTIPFTANHTPAFGLLVFGAFALVSGLAVGILSWSSLVGTRVRGTFATQGVVGIVVGVLALVTHTGGLGYFLYLVSVWGIVTGFLELYSGVRMRRLSPTARDWMVVGGATVLLAVVFLLIPADAVAAVGLLGAYLVVLGVYLGIAGLSLKWTMDTLVSPAVANDSDSL
ncbi:DUF308 domain-containing protein [Cryobacterium tepidiphilum]|jgi:uncharacterized membrane protein HdeD (DUF308 family)|uniref:HdeD family acid-resistance protein n=1 Tax=Cryobacterium tepidiphilum TaxID=2486026 RepID=A0A3M8LPZ3_9MICO|nr:DUF308 domain-containing protein [Cryobacterium tepidiphilum]RNE66932.1 hypothetical protein EEJ31_01605 [Cryobacterium tepidiphilum]